LRSHIRAPYSAAPLTRPSAAPAVTRSTIAPPRMKFPSAITLNALQLRAPGNAAKNIALAPTLMDLETSAVFRTTRFIQGDGAKILIAVMEPTRIEITQERPTV